MKKAFICSPYRAKDKVGIEKNIKIAKAMCRYALDNNLAPIAPHLIYPQFMSDKLEKERDVSIQAGIEFLKTCQTILVYSGVEPTEGMKMEITIARLEPSILFFYVGDPVLSSYIEEIDKFEKDC